MKVTASDIGVCGDFDKTVGVLSTGGMYSLKGLECAITLNMLYMEQQVTLYSDVLQEPVNNVYCIIMVVIVKLSRIDRKYEIRKSYLQRSEITW